MTARSRILFSVPAFTMIFALGLSLDTNLSRWHEVGGLISSAEAQMPLEGCTQALIPHRVDGASYYKCDNGQYFRDVGGRFAEVDHQGRLISDPNSAPTEPEPETATVAPPPEPAAEPTFQKAPDPNSGEAASHFKKVPQ